MLSISARTCITIALALCAVGCRSGAKRQADFPSSTTTAKTVGTDVPTSSVQSPTILPVAFQSEDSGMPEFIEPDDADSLLPAGLEPLPEVVATPIPTDISLQSVTESVRNHFPLIMQAIAERRIASGQALSASGAFDHKLEAFTESQPLDFYENYRHSIGVKRDTTWGGQTFAGYRIGRGVFEPWYLERETNKGGEFKAGFLAPVIRDRDIDSNRSELWQAQLERSRVEPEILAQVIRYVRDGSVAYWQWVGAGANEQIAIDLLELAEERTEALEAQVEAQEKAPIDLVDNRRIIVSREAKLIDAQRKLQQATVKLSLFYRTYGGDPVLVDPNSFRNGFYSQTLQSNDVANLILDPDDINLALARRPELTELQIVSQQLRVALRQANNETLPDVDAGVFVKQDVGEPTSAKRDKSEFELEALMTVSVPIERRKAYGKIRSLQGKLAQVRAKNRFTADKISAEVQIARAAIEAAHQRVIRATESYELAQQMQEAEQQRFELGQSTLFNLNIREKQAAEAASEKVAALLEYHIARADYGAALGLDGPVTLE